MKKLYSVSELIAAGYPSRWLKRIIHSEDFALAGGRREPVPKSKIYFDISELDRYLKKQTEINF